MEAYFVVKWLHVLSSTLLFGTGLGTAFFMWMAHRRGDVGTIAVTARHVVLADWLFTTPSVIFQPLMPVLITKSRVRFSSHRTRSEKSSVKSRQPSVCSAPCVMLSPAKSHFTG